MPYAREQVLGFMRWRVIAGVDVVGDSWYARTLEIGGARGWVRASFEDDRSGEGVSGAPLGCVRVDVSEELEAYGDTVVGGVRRLFDLDADGAAIDGALGAHALFRVHVARVPGVRVPGAVDAFEVAWRAVLGQQVSVKAAGTLAARFVAKFGEEVKTPVEGLRLVSPSAARIASARVDSIAKIGMPGTRAGALKAIARAFADDPELVAPRQDPEAARERLLELPGIGPWTAEYLLMRVARHTDAFPASDLGVKKALESRGLKAGASEEWRPWRAYATMRLWGML